MYIGAAVIEGWGIAHLANTAGVLQSFKPMAPDTRRVVAMEWIMEVLLLVFIAVLVVVFTVAGAPQAARLVDWLSGSVLVVMAIVSLLTGARASFWAYNLCPMIFLSAATLFVIGSP